MQVFDSDNTPLQIFELTNLHERRRLVCPPTQLHHDDHAPHISTGVGVTMLRQFFDSDNTPLQIFELTNLHWRVRVIFPLTQFPHNDHADQMSDATGTEP